jgi:hypothetical protein
MQFDRLLNTLQAADETKFVNEMLAITEARATREWNGDAEFYQAHALHNRDDHFAGKLNKKDLLGKRVNSAFTSSVLFRRYNNCMDLMPNHVAISSTKLLAAWANSISVESDHPNGVEDFKHPSGASYKCFIENRDARAKIAKAVGNIDWDKARCDVYAAVPFDEHVNGYVFAPAFNSLWIVREAPGGRLLLWFVQAASASSVPGTGFFGVEFDEPIISGAGQHFHVLSDARNPYRVTLSDEPLELTIEVFHEAHDPQMTQPYITVTSVFTPATADEIARVIGEVGKDDMHDEATRQACRLIMKGALMQSVVSTYFPQLSDAENFAIVDKEKDVEKRLAEQLADGDDGSYSLQDAVKSLDVGVDIKIIGPLLHMFNDCKQCSGGLWIIPPQAEASQIPHPDITSAAKQQQQARDGQLIVHVA